MLAVVFVSDDCFLFVCLFGEIFFNPFFFFFFFFNHWLLLFNSSQKHVLFKMAGLSPVLKLLGKEIQKKLKKSRIISLIKKKNPT